MRYWQLTKENGREMLDRLNSYMKEGYIWLVVPHKVGGQIHDFTIVFHCDFSLSKEDNCSQWYIDKYDEKFQIGDYLVFKDARLFITSAEGFKKLEEEEARETEARECEKKVLLKQLLEAYNKHNYTRSTILHNKLMEMGMTENEIMGEVNALLCVKPKVEKDETKEVDIETSSTPPIDELQKILVRRAQLQKELAEIEETLTKKYEIKVINTENK